MAQLFPENFQGFGTALQEAYPLLLSMANSMQQGQSPFAQSPQGLAAMMQMQEKRDEKAAQERDTGLLAQMLGGGFGGTVSTRGSAGMPRNQAMASYGGPTNAAAQAMNAPAGWEQIRNGIFAGESGGDYNALFGYSNRPGQPFSNVRLTDMTVDEAIAFSDPSGPYGQWVKGQVGRVATPMGAYQIVGTTLRGAKEALGLSGNERMTPALQELLGQHIYRTQGTGAWEGYKGPREATVSTRGTSIDPNRLAQVLQSPNISDAAKQLVLQRYTQGQQQPEPGFRVLTPQEKQQFGLPPEVSFQVGPDGKISQIGGSGTSVTVNNNPAEVDLRPMADKPPKGYQRVWDEAAGTWRDTPIPGSDEARTVATEDRAMQTAMAAYDRKYSLVDAKIDEAMQSITENGRWVSGWGSMLSSIPETEARSFQNIIDTIKANLGFEELQAMRDSSPTGGALGQVTERELAFLQSIMGSLDTAQDPPQLFAILEDIKTRRAEFKAERDRIMSGAQPSVQQPQQQQQPASQAPTQAGTAPQLSGRNNARTGGNPYAGISDQDFYSMDLSKMTPEQIDLLFEARGGQ